MVSVEPLLLVEDVAVRPQAHTVGNELPQLAGRMYRNISWGPMPLLGW